MKALRLRTPISGDPNGGRSVVVPVRNSSGCPRRPRAFVAALAASVLVASGLAEPAIAATPPALGGRQVQVSQTSGLLGQILPALPELAFAASDRPPATGPRIVIDDSKRFQPIWGVGGALTNSSAFLLEHGVSPTQREQLIANLFGPQQTHLSLVRIPIGGSDFNASGQRYSDDDMPPGQTDPWLRHFSLAHDRDAIAVLQEALRVNPGLKVIASPWTAPAWMKTNHSLTNRHFRGKLKPEYYSAYARYFVRFVEGYKQAGIPIFAVTVQNEPVNVPAAYEGMNFPRAKAGDFVRWFLRPALRSAGLSTQIFGTDESWNHESYARGEAAAAGGLNGQAWHCYQGNPDLVMPRFIGTPQIMSECALSLIRSPVSSVMTNVFNDGASAGLVWNLALTPDGGPYVAADRGCPNCRGVLYVNPSTQHVSYTPAFFQLGQFGRFIEPGAQRIAATRLGHFLDVKGSNRASAGLHDVAIRNPDGSDVLFVFNNSAETATFTVSWRTTSVVTSVPAGATTSFRWQAR